MNEYAHLINDYLCINPIIRNLGFCAISAENLNSALHRLAPFERPDMYAELEDMIVILEHFEFDASHSIKGSLLGKREEAEIEKRIHRTPNDNEFHIDIAQYRKSLEDWQNNFERIFKKHYGKIDDYKKRIDAHCGEMGKNIVVGFWIEDQYPPYVEVNEEETWLLPYVYTTQFVDVFNMSPGVDFVLYAYLDKVPKLIYLDHTTIKTVAHTIDLCDSAVTLSKCNDNELIIYGGFIAE